MTQIANSVSLQTDFFTSPYYDDFDETKNFHRILFRPGLAVQARELTQLQTILQNQIDRFGEHIFQEGSVVRGCEVNYENNLEFVRLQDTNVSNTVITPADFVGAELTGNTSGVTAVVVDSESGSEAASPDTNTLYIKYTNSGTDKTTKTFASNEVLNSNTGLSATTLSANTTGSGTRITFGQGIIFAKDNFIRIPEQSIIVGKYSTTESHRVGYFLNEEIVDSGDDPSLLDPAQGSYNVNAPGADRLKIDPILTKRTFDQSSENDPDFIEIFRIKNGEPEYNGSKPIYSQINDYIARRTYEESGNYIVNGLTIRLREHLKQSNNSGVFTSGQGGNNELLSADVAPGKAYVLGYRQENLITRHVPVDKGIDFNSIEQATTSTNYSNYVTVNEVVGTWDINGHSKVSLRDTAMNAVTNSEYSTTGAEGSEIGTARVRAIEYSTGTPGQAAAEYRLYLYDINVSNGAFSDVRSVYINNTSPESDGKADIVLQSGNAVLEGTSFNRAVFNVPASSLKTIRDENGNIDTNFQFLKKFNVTIATDGTFTIDTGVSDEQFPFSTGLLNDTQKLENFTVTLNESVDSFSAGQIISMAATGTDGDRTINITSSTGASFDIQETLSSTISATVHCKLSRVDGKEKAKIFNSNRFVQIECANNTANTVGPWDLGFSDVFAIEEVRHKSGSAFTSESEGTDVTDEFRLNTGQTDNLYNHGRLKKKTSSNLSLGSSDFLLVKLDYFSHDTSQGIGYFSIDSYPIDDDLASNTSAITTQEIPIFTSPVTGDEFDLRDSIDIRPRIQDTATDTTSVGSATVNPSSSTTIVEPSGGLHYSVPNENYITDLDYYLPRIDRIVVDRKNKYRVIRGVSSNEPLAPAEPSDGMSLSTIFVAPYPSLPPVNAKKIGREDLAASVTPDRIKRYTMENISTLENRIENLEYYTSLSLLETETKALSVTDNNGLNRFKNGIFVDNFKGHRFSDVDNPDYNISMDSSRGEIRPTFEPEEINLKFSSGNSSNIQTSPKDVVLTIDEDVDFTDDETISGGGASGTLRYQVDSKLYLEDVSGTFGTGTTITGGTSGTTATTNNERTIGEGKYATLPYTHDQLVSQPIATSTRNAAGLAYTWYGELELDPEEDIWVETVRAPDVNVTINNRNNVTQPRNFGWFGTWGWRWNWGWWNSWGWGGPTIGLWNWGWRPRTRTQTRTTTTVERQSLGDQIIDSEVIPFIRPQLVNFTGTSLKPNTRFYCFFDDEDVNDYCRPTDSSFANTDSFGSAIESDADGNVYGQFNIPNNNEIQFRTGTKEFKLTDSINNSDEVGSFTSFAEADFTASGERQTVQETIVTTRTTRVERRRVRVDPIAQTFRLPTSEEENEEAASGGYLTKLDLYFQSKDDTQPCIVELREVDPATAYVTNNVIPMSTVYLTPDQINTSEDGTKPTPVYFKTPLYVQSNTDYAIVIKPGGGSPNYNVFIARLGETDLVTGARMGINPYSGVLFVSANDRTWTAIQEEDLKFNAYFANFGTDASGYASFQNGDREFLKVANVSTAFSSGSKVHGETTLTLSSTPTANVGEFASGDSSNANGEITLISGSDVRVKDVTLNNKYTNGETITYYFANGTPTGSSSTLSSQSTPSGIVAKYDDYYAANTRLQISDSTGDFVANTQLKTQDDGYTATLEEIGTMKVDLANIFVSKLELDKSQTTIEGKLATTTSSLENTYKSYKDAEDTIPQSRRFVLSRTTENNNLSGSKSCDFRINISNGDDVRHSPAIDIGKIGFLGVENIVNNLTTNETDSEGGDALARYISRTITLADNQDAEDLKLFLTAYRPQTADIKVYYKILNASDSQEIGDIEWTEMDQSTLTNVYSDSEDREDMIEYEYEVPSANLSGPNGEIQYTDANGNTLTGYKYYKIKIVLTSTSTSNVPRVSNLRTIALQI